MKDYKNILFDLDGTLIDPKEGITNSAKYALEYFGVDVEKKEDLYRFIGPPLRDSFSQYYGFNEADTEMAVKKYREYFKEKGVFQNTLYKGVLELLNELVNTNKKLIIATSKAEIFAKQILDNFDISKYFSFICGSTLDGSRSKKGQVIQHILSKNNLTSKDSIMIGDKSHDIIGANENKLDSIGVLYGYGNYKELINAGATYIAKNVEELRNILKADDIKKENTKENGKKEKEEEYEIEYDESDQIDD